MAHRQRTTVQRGMNAIRPRVGLATRVRLSIGLVLHGINPPANPRRDTISSPTSGRDAPGSPGNDPSFHPSKAHLAHSGKPNSAQQRKCGLGANGGHQDAVVCLLVVGVSLKNSAVLGSKARLLRMFMRDAMVPCFGSRRETDAAVEND